ncbi:hypothetical protein D3C80_893530 [compost metagenome]
MATAAVPRPLDQIGAAIPLCALVVVRLVRRIVMEQLIPYRQRPAHRQRPTDVTGAVGGILRRHFVHQVVIQRAHIFRIHFGVGGIRHRRIKPVAVFSDPLTHGAVKLIKRISADALLFVRRDIGGVDIAQRRRELHAAGKQCAAWRGMAGGTVTGLGHVFPGRHRLGRTARRQ